MICYRRWSLRRAKACTGHFTANHGRRSADTANIYEVSVYQARYSSKFWQFRLVYHLANSPPQAHKYQYKSATRIQEWWADFGCRHRWSIYTYPPEGKYEAGRGASARKGEAMLCQFIWTSENTTETILSSLIGAMSSRWTDTLARNTVAGRCLQTDAFDYHVDSLVHGISYLHSGVRRHRSCQLRCHLVLVIRVEVPSTAMNSSERKDSKTKNKQRHMRCSCS